VGDLSGFGYRLVYENKKRGREEGRDEKKERKVMS